MAEETPTREAVLDMLNILKECQEKNYIRDEPGYVRSIILTVQDDGFESPGLKSPEWWSLLTPDEQTYVNNILAQVSN
jgi:hypothetical protein